MFAIEFGSNSCTKTCTALYMPVTVLHKQFYTSFICKLMAILIKDVKTKASYFSYAKLIHVAAEL